MCAHCPEPESGLLFCQCSISSVSALSCRYSVHANYHRAFREKYNLPFTLIADTDKSINQRYGVWVERERDGKKIMGSARTTFLINEKGEITDIIQNIDAANHASQIISH